MKSPTLARRLIGKTRRLGLFGVSRGKRPLDGYWGWGRGNTIDRHFIEQFLASHRADIHGSVLEVGDTLYTSRFGAGIARFEVLDIDPDNPAATIVADLAAASHVPSGTFDCFILVQTLQYVYDLQSAVAHAYRILRPGGVLLATVPAISRVTPGSLHDTDWWRFTPGAAARLFGEAFGSRQVTVRSYGNVITGMAFFTGMACEDLFAEDLETHDADFPLLIAVRAIKEVT